MNWIYILNSGYCDNDSEPLDSIKAVNFMMR
jgi:hypothetical protein